MRKILLAFATLAIAGVAIAAKASEAPQIVDPISGELIALNALDWENLTDEQKEDVQAQLVVLKDARQDEIAARIQAEQGLTDEETAEIREEMDTREAERSERREERKQDRAERKAKQGS